MQVACEELADLKGVWGDLSKIWERLDEMKENPWLSIQPIKLRKGLNELLQNLKDLPAGLRHYACYEFLKRTIQGYQKVFY